MPQKEAASDSSSSCIQVPELDGFYTQPLSAGKLYRLAGSFGPAAVIASLSIGAGETIMVTGVGAWAEYGLLWLVLLSVLTKGVFVTYLLGRYTAASGQHIGPRLLQLPGPRGWLLHAIVWMELIAMTLALAAVAKPCGNLVVYLLRASLPGSVSHATWENLCTTLFLAAALILSLYTSYMALEKQQIVICGILVGGTILSTFMIGPRVVDALVGTFRFGHLPPVPEWAPPTVRNDYWLNLATVFGYVGSTVSPYIAYANWISIRGFGLSGHPNIQDIRARADASARIDYLPDDPAEAHRLRALLSPLRWDVGMGAVVLFIVTASFMMAGAVGLYPRHLSLPGNAFDLLTRQGHIWEHLHRGLVPVYYVAVLAALWGTLATIPEAETRVAHEFFSAIWPRFASFPFRGLQAIIVLWFLVASCFWIWSGVSFDLLTQIVALLATNLGVALICVAALYLNFKLPPRYRTRWWMLAGGVISALILFLAFAGSAVGLLRKL